MHDIHSVKNSRTIGSGYSPGEVRSGLWYCLIAWIFGSAFVAISSGAAFNSFVTKYLHTSDTVYGLMMAVASVGVIFQVLGSYVIERTGRIKRNFLIYATIHRLLWLGVAAVPLFLPVKPGVTSVMQVLLVSFIVVVSASVANYGGVGWTAWMSGIVPKAMAGRFFGNRARLGLIAMVITAIGVSYLLDHFPGQGWMYALAFGAAALLGAVDILLFLPVREIPQPVNNTSTLLDIVVTPWHDALFRRFVLYTVVTWISYMMMGSFAWRYCFDSAEAHGLDMSISRANLLLFIIPTVMMAWVAPFWGQAIDRFGPKPILAASSFSQIIIPAFWIIMRPEWSWLIFVISILVGLTWPGIDQVTFYVQLKIFPENRRSAYIAVFVVMFAFAGMVGTVLGGYYATFWQTILAHTAGVPGWVSHYHPLFATSILIRLFAFIFLLPTLPLPGAAAKKHVAHSIAHGIATSLPRRPSARRRKRGTPVESE